MTAVSADSVVVELIARTDGARSGVSRYVADFEGGMGRVNRAAAGMETGLARSAAATRNLGRQISDIGVGLAGGQSPFLIIAQQAPQIADALADTGGKAAKLAAFFAGPWGAALLAAGSIVGVLAGHILEAGDAADSRKKAVDALKEAVDRLNGAAASANHTTELGIQEDINAAEALRQREIRTRRQIQAELDLAKARLSAAQVSEKYNPIGIPGQGAASRGVDVADLNRQIAEQNGKIAEADKAIRSGQGAIALRHIAAATDAATAATQKYENAIDRLRRKQEAGTITGAQFESMGISAKRELDGTLKAITESRRAISRGSSEAIAEARRAAKERAKIMAEVNADPTLDLMKDNRGLLKSLGLDDADKELRAITDEIGKMQKARVDTQGEAIEDGLRRQEEGIRTLSGLYYDLFSRGTKGLWQDFKQIGLQALAELAAKKTFSAILGLATSASSGGGILGSVASLFSGGRASGGYTPPGSMVRVNEGASPGRVEGFVGPSTGGKVIPLGQMDAATGGGHTTIVNQSFTLDARYGITTPELIEHVNSTAQQAALFGARAGAMGGASEAKRQLTRPGLPRSAG